MPSPSACIVLAAIDACSLPISSTPSLLFTPHHRIYRVDEGSFLPSFWMDSPIVALASARTRGWMLCPQEPHTHSHFLPLWVPHFRKTNPSRPLKFRRWPGSNRTSPPSQIKPPRSPRNRQPLASDKTFSVYAYYISGIPIFASGLPRATNSVLFTFTCPVFTKHPTSLHSP